MDRVQNETVMVRTEVESSVINDRNKYIIWYGHDQRMNYDRQKR